MVMLGGQSPEIDLKDMSYELLVECIAGTCLLIIRAEQEYGADTHEISAVLTKVTEGVPPETMSDREQDLLALAREVYDKIKTITDEEA